MQFAEQIQTTNALAVGGAVLAAGLLVSYVGGRSSSDIPVIGSNGGLFASQIASLRSLAAVKEWVVEGYRKYHDSVFKMRVFQDWMLVISSPALIDELRKAPDDVLSFREATAITLQSDHTLGDWRNESQLHVGLIKTRLTRALPDLFPSVIEEIDAAFSDEITRKLSKDEWTTIPAVEPLSRIVCRTSNRIFVGLPLCRNEEYVKLNVQYTVDVVVSANIIKQFPDFLKPLAGRYLTPIPRALGTAERLMADFIDERKRLTATHGKDWEEKPNDFLQWVLEAGDEGDRATPNIVARILRLNFAAIHTTALSFTFALYHIAAEPDKYQAPLRAEAHEVLSRYGWSKAAMERMRRLDSLLRETQRFHGLGALSMTRLAMRDFTFSDGTLVKKGQLVSVASRGVHFDGELYSHPDEFDGFRFYDEVEVHGEELPNRLVSTGFDFLTFGTGRHACPGRFWAANEMKAMMAYMLVNYDFRMENDEVPKEQWFAAAVVPDRHARLLIRKRETPQY